MRRVHRTLILATIATLGMAASCNKPGVETTPFDKASLLTNVADNLIAPSFSTFDATVSQLESDFIDFQSNPTEAALNAVRVSWKDAYLTWQTAKPFDFGPMKTNGYKAAIGTYPSDTAQIESNIAAGSYSLSSAANIDAIGLHALDFLLHRVDALSYFVGSANYMTYASDLIQKLKTESSSLVSSWASYAATFKESTGTETTSGFSQLVNEFNRDYELCKNAKLGVPIGRQSLGIQMPEYLEARNSGISLELLRQNVLALKQYYNGDTFATSNTGIGFDDYLLHLERSGLDETICNNFTEILNKIDSFSGTMEDEMASNAQGLDELYTLMQGQVVSLKTDMTSSFGVLITYQDNDGD